MLPMSTNSSPTGNRPLSLLLVVVVLVIIIIVTLNHPSDMQIAMTNSHMYCHTLTEMCNKQNQPGPAASETDSE